MIKTRTTGRWELLLALGGAWWNEKLFTLEWSYPYCTILYDGPAAAVYGFPFPYQQASIATSATDFFIPWLYVINLALIAGGILILLRTLLSPFETSNSRWWKFIIGSAGTVLLILAVSFEVFVLTIGVWRPTSSLSESFNYSELRPVGVRIYEHRSRDCTASSFWFPEHKRSK
jgi:lysylphosphatidylglycerol synthetase-like protein (DUF2156 family)